VQFRTFGNQGRRAGIETHVSHDSHRGREKACEKQEPCVKSAFLSIQGKGLEGTRPAQWTRLPRVPQKRDELWGTRYGMGHGTVPWMVPAGEGSHCSTPQKRSGGFEKE
jgi:hypothetical protein